MKKINTIISAALVVLAAASCTKDMTVSTPGMQFTAQFGSTKIGIDALGKVTWTAGDVIVLYNGNNSASAIFTDGTCTSENIQIINVTDGMIGNDGKSVTFSVTISQPTGNNWYAYATNDAKNINTILSSGAASMNFVSTSDASSIPFFAASKSAKTSSSLSFHHAAGLVKMVCSKTATKLVITSNSGSDIASGATVCVGASEKVEVTDTIATTASMNVNIEGVSAEDSVYVALIGKTYKSGISIKAYNGDVADASLVGQAKIEKAFTVTAGKIINIGDFIQKGKKGWSWTLDWASRSKNFDRPSAVAKEDNDKGELKFVHTNPKAEYKVGTVTEQQIDTTTFCFGATASKQGYGYYGGHKNDYWSIKCLGSLPAGTKLKVKFLVFGDNQAMAFWNGGYSIDGGDITYLPTESKSYDWAKKTTGALSWSVQCTCRYILAYGPRGNAAGSWAHFVEETITLPTAMTSSFEFRLVVADNVFHKASVSYPGTVSSDPLHSLAIVASGTRGSETVTCDAITVEVVE